MVDMFKKVYNDEKNENTAFVLMLGVLSEKLTEIINLLSDNNRTLDLIRKDLKILKEEKVEFDNKKVYMPLTAEDYD